MRVMSWLKSVWWAGMILGAAALGTLPAAEDADRKPAAEDPARHAFPALGMGSERRVAMAWNRFYDHAGLGALLAQLHEAFPDLTRLYSIGRSVEGRDLWCLEVTARAVGDPARKPGMYIDGNIHGNEVQGGEVVAYTAWYLCHQYGRVEKVTDLLDHAVFYLIPTTNPDGRDAWLRGAQTSSSGRSGRMPVDDDHDGVADEDDVDDLDGDGAITQMRIRDPNGRWKPHPDFPGELMVPVGPDETGEYTLLGLEGLDNDGDGRVNEDPVGGYDMNRNWAWDWQPDYIQHGAHSYPFSLPETRAVARFVLDHPNIAALQSYHNAAGMILRGPGRPGGAMRAGDDRVLQFIGQRGEKILPYYRSMVIFKDLYTVWGGQLDWFYGARGILGFTTELWTSRNVSKADSSPRREEEAAFLRYVLLNEGVVKWKEFEHPTYGKIEIGGTKKEWGRVPPSFLLEEECHRNMAFTLYHADQMPRLRIREVKVEQLKEGLTKVWVGIENLRLMPTRTEQEAEHHSSAPDTVMLEGPETRVLSSGIVRDRFFKRVDAVKRRPQRVELETVGGLTTMWVQFVFAGRGPFTVRVDSARGGLIETQGNLGNNR